MGHGERGLIVLDTHVLVWLVGSPERLSPAAERALAGEDLGVSTASVQEIAYLAIRGRLDMDRPVARWLAAAMRAHEMRVLSATVGCALRAGSLDPQKFHGDPVDRLIYATAVEHDAQLLSADRRLLEADPERVVW